MKLLRLKINSAFSSLSEGFELNFRHPFVEGHKTNSDWDKFNPFCFAGLNGSGKSNVLEALANIFYHLEGCMNVKQPKNFKERFDPKLSTPNQYELEYYIVPKSGAAYVIQNMVKVFISKNENEVPLMAYLPYPFDGINPTPVTVVANKDGEFTAEAKKYVPDLIIGYSSGENEILSIPFLKTRLIHYDEYLEALNNKYEYFEPESNLLYIDYEMSQAVLLSNLLFQDQAVLKPLEKELGILGIKRFRMNLNVHTEGKYRILDQFQDTINAFKNCATSQYVTDDRLILDFWINDASKEAFRENFNHDIFKLFQSFQILYTLNYRTVSSSTKSDVYQSKGYYTDGKVPTPAPEDKVFHFLDYYLEKKVKGTQRIISLLLKNLSDGEQQFLHSMGICLMLKNRSSLLLLDEPETHFNPDWRSKFIRTLQKSLEASKSNNMMMDLLITSHSPFIISDCFPDKVIYFRRNKEKDFEVECVNAKQMNLKTFGSSVDIILEVLFNKRQTIGDLSKSKLQYDLSKIKSKKDVEKLKAEIDYLGDSLEKDLLLASLNEIKFQ